jgi:hypothetical protein
LKKVFTDSEEKKHSAPNESICKESLTDNDGLSDQNLIFKPNKNAQDLSQSDEYEVRIRPFTTVPV